MFFGESKCDNSFLFTEYHAVLWESKNVNSSLFTNYHGLGLQSNNLGGPWLAGQQEYFSCWLLDVFHRLSVSDILILFSFLAFLWPLQIFLRLAETNVIKLSLKGVNLGVTSFSFACIRFAILKCCFENSNA